MICVENAQDTLQIRWTVDYEICVCKKAKQQKRSCSIWNQEFDHPSREENMSNRGKTTNITNQEFKRLQEVLELGTFMAQCGLWKILEKKF